MMQRFGHLSARPVADADGRFLEELYAATRTDLLHLPVPREVVAAIIRQQQQLQAEGYAHTYPGAHFLVLEDEGVPVGRVVLNRSPGDLRVVDLSIAPAARRKGHARAVLRALQELAADEGISVSLRVRRDNPEARALYASLGFELTASDDMAEQMRWMKA